MKPLLILLALSASVAAAEGPEPAPWWQQVENTQTLLLHWIGALTIVGTTLITAVATLWMLLNSKIKEIKERQDRQAAKSGQLQAQVVDIAQKTPASGAPCR